MSDETKNEDLLSLAKEHVRLMKWLVRTLMFQAVIFVPVGLLLLWILFQELIPRRF